MKYEYGVEYETNGEKPDLPDDVLVVFKNTRGNQGKCRAEDVYWHNCKSFRIADERYKPQPNDWYKRGELPPVGEVVEGYVQDSARQWKWLEVEILKHNNISDNECAVHVIKHAILRWCDQFRPLRTERDVLVDKAADAMRGTEVNLTGPHLQVLSRQLIDANWRPINQQSEDEFVKQAWDEYGAFKQAAELLYRAGCRFVDVENNI